MFESVVFFFMSNISENGWFFFFKQKTAYEMDGRLEFRRVLFRSAATSRSPGTRRQGSMTASPPRRRRRSPDRPGPRRWSRSPLRPGSANHACRRLPPLSPVALEPEVVVPEGCRLVVEVGELRVRLLEVVARRGHERLLVHPGLDALGPVLENLAQSPEVVLY